MCTRNRWRGISIFRAIPGSIHFSPPKEPSWGGCTGHGWFRDKGREGEIHYVYGWPADALRIWREFHEGRETARSGVCAMSGKQLRWGRLQAGPAVLGDP